MFDMTNARFSNVAQVERTVKYLKENKTTLRVQYTPSLKVKVIDLMLEEQVAAENGKDTFLIEKGKNKGKFSKVKFLEACGLRKCYNTVYEWENVYKRLDGNANVDPNVVNLSRQGLGKLHTAAESKGLGDLAREANALIRKTKELNLKHDAEKMGFKLVKVA